MTAATRDLVLSIRIRSEAEVKAEALREAADLIYSDEGANDPFVPGSIATWLQNRANELEGK